MSGAYPHFKLSYTHEEVVEHFLLTPADLQLVWTCRGETNLCGMALLLKALTYLGYVPDSLDGVPHDVRSFIAGQLGLLWDFSEAYRWDSRTRGQHLFEIRQHTGWRFPTGQDKDDLERWLRREAAYEVQDAERLMEYACQRLRHLRVELPVERELQRIVDAALNGFFQDIYRHIAEAVPADVRTRIDDLLVGHGSGVFSAFEQLKGDPGRPGIKNLQAEIAKLRAIHGIGLGDEPFAGVPLKVLQLLKRRATNETASEMRHHLDDIRYALVGCFLHVRALEVTDDVTRMTIDLIQRLGTRSEKQLHREWLADLERVAGKMQILADVAEAVIGGRIQDIAKHLRDVGESNKEEDQPVPTTTSIRQRIASAMTQLKSWEVEPTVEKICTLTDLPADEVEVHLTSLLTGKPTAGERASDAALQAQYVEDFLTYQQRTAGVRALLEPLRAAEAARRRSYEDLRHSAHAAGRAIGTLSYPDLPVGLLANWEVQSAGVCDTTPEAVPGQRQTAQSGVVAVKFLRSFGPYGPGEVAAFALEEVETLVARGVAQVETP